MNALPEAQTYRETLRRYESGQLTDLDVTLARADMVRAYDKAHAALAAAVAHYDSLGGLAVDRLSRRIAAESLAFDTGLEYADAAQLLADALAQRAAMNPNQLNKE